MGTFWTRATGYIDALLDKAESQGRCAWTDDRYTRRLVRRRCQAGYLVEPTPGVFARKATWSELDAGQRHTALMRALGELHPHWVFCGFSSAHAHGLFVPKERLDKVHVASSCAWENDAVRYWREPALDFTTVDGMRVTPLEKTVFSCMCKSSFVEGLAIADSGLAALGLSEGEFYHRVAHALRGHKGVQRALSIARHADARSESGGESVARAIMIEEGFAVPDLQVEIADPLVRGGVFRVDFYWELDGGSRKVAGEFDGMVKYDDPRFRNGRTKVEVLMDEREREFHLNAAGVQVVRFKYRHVIDRACFAGLLKQFGIPRHACV